MTASGSSPAWFIVYTNPSGAFNRYDAVQVVGRKRYSRGWQMQSSYTWSKNRGTVGNRWHVNAARYDLGNPGRFVNPNTNINAFGRASFDPTHEAKLLGGNQTVRIEPVGTRRAPAINTLDLRVEKTLAVPRLAGTLGVFLDAFNLSNQGVPDSDVTNPIAESSGSRFGEPNAWRDPRMFRAGIRLTF